MSVLKNYLKIGGRKNEINRYFKIDVRRKL